jgi:CHAD domain-containing protein
MSGPLPALFTADCRSYASYSPPAGTQPADLQRRLNGAWRTRLESPGDVVRCYLDTFDWRIYRSGSLLVAKQSARVLGLIWEDRRHAKPLASCRVETLPRWPEDVPAGVLRDRLSPVVEMRALLPMARVRSRSWVLRVLNEDDKTVARLLLEQSECLTEGKQIIAALTPRLTLIPVKGYNKSAKRLAHFLEQDLALPLAADNRLEEALALQGRQPCDYSSKLDVQLNPEMAADTALRHVLRHLLGTLEANIAGSRDDLDSEFLHDLRVATRRTRSALSQVKDVLPPQVVTDFKQRFGWLGQVTGPTRDLDVFLLDFPRYRQSLPAELQADLDPLLPYLREHQREAQQTLRRQLASPYFHRLLKDWHEFLAQPPAGPDAGPKARVPIREVAGARLWRMYRRVLREGRAITDDSPAEDLHELRKSCKKLRYLLEFFASLYPKAKIKPLIKQLKRLLDNLGDFQDLHIQAERLRVFGEDLQRERGDRLPVVLAIGTLIGDLLRRQMQARAAFASLFAAFDDASQYKICRAMFKRGEAPR